MMDHQAAVNAKLLDRYLLGELSEEERDKFEEHYFACPICAAELVSAQKFLDNARKPLLAVSETAGAGELAAAKEERAPFWERWLAIVPKPALAGACVCLLAVVVWQSGSQRTEPEVLGSYFVTATRSAGGESLKIRVAKGQRRVALLFNRTNPSVKRYAYSLTNASGQKVMQFESDAPSDTNDLQVLIPVDRLAAGVYTLQVANAANQTEVAKLPFELEKP